MLICMFKTALLRNRKGLSYHFITATFLKAFLLFFLSLGQSHADDVLAQITAHLAKTEITQGDFYFLMGFWIGELHPHDLLRLYNTRPFHFLT
jgi:hypothetical protein